MANDWLKDVAAIAADVLEGAHDALNVVARNLDKAFDFVGEAEDFVHQFTVAEAGAVEDEPSQLEKTLKSYDRYLRVNIGEVDAFRRAVGVEKMKTVYVKEEFSDDQLKEEMRLWDEWADRADRENHLY